MTDSTAPAPAPQERSIPIEQLLGHYREQTSQLGEQLFVARALYAAAEEECARLRLRVIELEQHAAEPEPATRGRARA